jgi:hypothetical protein
VKPPQVSVIIPTYNWSSVLRYAVASALDQTFADIEVIVVGDGCTDDSEGVVFSFRDPRVLWENLERNSGNQSAPNNRGLALARGRWIAYLGHDDLWHPTHLETLVRAIESSGADLVYSVTQVLGAPGSADRRLIGVTSDGAHPARLFAPPSSILHRTGLARDVGGWRDYRTIRLPPDFDFLRRVWEQGKKILSVNELTVFKFPSGLRPGSYRERLCGEQAEWSRRMADEPEFRYRELMDTVRSLAGKHPDLVSETWIPEDVSPGEIVEGLRAIRGLPPGDALPAAERTADSSPSGGPADALRRWNRRDDVAPLRYRQALHLGIEVPPDAILLGGGWHDPETDEWGLRFRWAGSRARLVATAVSTGPRKCWLELFPGPGAGAEPLRLRVVDEAGSEVARLELATRQRVEIDWPATPGDGAALTLISENGGRRIPTDPRILDFAIAAFDWV